MHARRQRLQLREQPRLVTVNAQLTARIVEFASLRNEGAQGLKLGSTQREIGAVTEQNTVRPAVERLKNLCERHGPIVDLHRNAQAEPVTRIALAHGDFNERVGCLHELWRSADKTHLNSGNTAKLRQNRAEQLAGFPAFDAALLQPGKRRVGSKNGAHRTQYARLKTLVANLAALFTGVTENGQGLHIGSTRSILRARLLCTVLREGVQRVLPMPAQLRVVANLLVKADFKHQMRRLHARQRQRRIGGQGGNGAAERGQVLLLERGAFRGGNVHGSGANERFGGGIERLDQGDERQLHTLGQLGHGGGVSRPLTLRRGNRRCAIFSLLSRRLLHVLLHKGFAAHFVQRAGARGLPVHSLCRLLVLLLSEPAQGKEAGARGADGVAVGGGQPELAQ